MIGVRLQPDQLAALDAFAAAEPDAPTRPEAVRRLVARGLGTGKRPVAQAPSAQGLDDDEHADHCGGIDGDASEEPQQASAGQGKPADPPNPAKPAEKR